ncbi:pilus assembly protein TadG-related protein [Roseovarius amoyensis]|uniref:pilus assembly protein TadG-related protein n=1 Tax=Roseovarius amoyensis TaxID=2211448 RepID=UPI0013A6FC4C|nr:pilus assembly protein TadG-related protein [Roseovarius amoyensis]
MRTCKKMPSYLRATAVAQLFSALFQAGPRKPAALCRFAKDENGAMALLLLILFPALILIGGLAVDVTQLNAQKSYIQGQADLAAQSAASHLHDLDEAREIARAVVRRNDQYGTIELVDDEIVFGAYDDEDGFVQAADQSDPSGVNAVEVTVDTPWRTLLWSAIIDESNYVISRSAVARSGPPVVSFTLRNTLLSLDTRDSTLLAPLLGTLLGEDALGLNLSVLSYQGVVNTDVAINDLIGLVTLGTSLNLITFEELLDLTLTSESVVQMLVDKGALDSGVLVGSDIPDSTLSLGELITVQPSLAQVRVGNILPNLNINAADLLLATAGLSGFGPTERLEVDAGLDLSPLANVTLETGLIRAPVSFIVQFDKDDPFTAEVTQADIDLTADVARLLDLSLSLSAATATATLTDVDCGASEPGDTLATFSTTTAPAALGIELSLLSPIDGNDAAQTPAPNNIAGHTQDIDIRLDQIGVPVPVPGHLSLASLTSSLSTVLSDIESDLDTQRDATQRNCGLLGCLLGTLLGTILSTLNTVISEVTNLLALPILDGLAEAILDLLGIDVARAEIILDDYTCTSSASTLVR